MSTAMKFKRVCDGLYRGAHGVEMLRVSTAGARYSDWCVWVGEYRAPRYYTTLYAAKAHVQKAYAVACGFAVFTKE
jgi:hypothetical protein